MVLVARAARRGARPGRLRWRFFAGHSAARAPGSRRFACAVGFCATDEDGSCIPPALQVRCRSMTSLNSEFHAPFRHRPETFSGASQKRYLDYQSLQRARENDFRDNVTIPRARPRLNKKISDHPLHVAAALRHLFLIASKLDEAKAPVSGPLFIDIDIR